MHIPENSLTNKVALVTGAGSGMGKASAKILAYAGAAVALIGRDREPLEDTAREITHNGGRALALSADISSGDQMQAAVQQIIALWGRLDIVFANAGINGTWAPLEDLEEKDWDLTMNVNLKGTFLTLKHAIPHLKKQGGSVIVTSSVNGTRMFSNTGATAYACSKAAQVAMTKMLALEWARHGVRINVICPGFIESKIHESTVQRNLHDTKIPVEYPDGVVPLTHGAAGTAGEVAQLVWFLASDASSHITGTEIYIDGAQSLLQG
ncbi:MAG TPA: SDR family NAD(P)-dependent oxidoreductase [Prosthecobacter sp.]|nr:SDR family NAD(P)-dependent oxidoreductase [Prosthecobacter sp.]